VLFLAIIGALIAVRLFVAVVTYRSHEEREFRRADHDELRYWARNLKYVDERQWRRMLRHASRCKDCRVFLGNILRDKDEHQKLDEFLRVI